MITIWYSWNVKWRRLAHEQCHTFHMSMLCTANCKINHMCVHGCEIPLINNEIIVAMRSLCRCMAE